VPQPPEDLNILASNKKPQKLKAIVVLSSS